MALTALGPGMEEGEGHLPRSPASAWSWEWPSAPSSSSLGLDFRLSLSSSSPSIWWDWPMIGPSPLHIRSPFLLGNPASSVTCDRSSRDRSCSPRRWRSLPSSEGNYGIPLQYYSVSLFHGTPFEAGYVIGTAQGASLVSGALLAGRSWPPGPGGDPVRVRARYAWNVRRRCSRPHTARWSGRRSPSRPGWAGPPRASFRSRSARCQSSCRGPRSGSSGLSSDFGMLRSVIEFLAPAIYTAYGTDSIFLVVGVVTLAGLLFSFVMGQTTSRLRLS